MLDCLFAAGPDKPHNNYNLQLQQQQLIALAPPSICYNNYYNWYTASSVQLQMIALLVPRNYYNDY